MSEEQREPAGYTRSPSDLLRVVVYLVASVCLLALTHWATDSITGLERDVLDLADFLNGGAVRILGGLAQLLLLGVTVGAVVVPLATRRFRLLGYVLLADIVAGLLMSGALWWLDPAAPADQVNRLASSAGSDVDGILTGTTVATTVAVLVVLAPFVSRRWRRAGAAVTAALVLLRIVLALHYPAEVFLALTIGAASGAGVLLAFGRPDQRPSLAAIEAALRSTGLSVASVRPACRAGGRGHGQHRGRPVGVHVPAGHLLAADPARVDLLHLPAPGRVHLTPRAGAKEARLSAGSGRRRRARR